MVRAVGVHWVPGGAGRGVPAGGGVTTVAGGVGRGKRARHDRLCAGSGLRQAGWAGRRRRRVSCWWVAVAAIAVTVAGCGSTPGTATPTGHPAPSASPTAELQRPDGFPDLPPPPGDVAISATEVREEALLSQGFTVEQGTVVHASVRYELDHSVRRVVNHYRIELPAAGWRVTEDRPPEDGGSPAQQRHVLRVHRHGREATIAVAAAEGATVVRMSTLDVFQGRQPSRRPPVTTMPSWYDTLPWPPPGTRRYLVQVTTSVDAPPTYTLRYEPDPQQDPPSGALTVETLIDHYARHLPASGWGLENATERIERPAEQAGVIEHHLSVPVAGFGMAGLVTATQTTSAAGQQLGTQLTLTLQPADLPGSRP